MWCRRWIQTVAVVAALLGSVATAWAAPTATKSAVPMRDYTVQAGDSCGRLARRLYGDSHHVDLIHDYNDLGPLPHKLRPGLVLHVPVQATVGRQDPDARLTFVRNQVEAYTPAYHKGQTGEALAEGNRVGTLASSAAEISFVNETRMQLGEHSMVVIFGDTQGAGKHRRPVDVEQASLLKGTLRAHLADLSGPDPTIDRRPIAVSTPGARVVLARQDGEVHVDVDAQSTTRLAVLRGRSALAAAGRKVEVLAGFGSRADKGKAPTPPRPLPGAPSWQDAPPPLLLGRGGGLSVVLRYAASAGAPVVKWHRQVARDPSFNDLIEDIQVPAAELTWTLHDLPEGELFIRVSGIDSDRFEGIASAPAKTRTAVLRQLPSTQESPAIVVFPAGMLCGVDGAPASAADKTTLSPARDHTVRCALAQGGKPGAAAEVQIAAVDSGSVLAKLEPDHTQWSATAGERDLNFRLTDSTGAPLAVPVADLQIAAAPGVTVAPLIAGAGGEYHTHLRWPPTIVDLALSVQVRGVKLAAVPLNLDPRDSEPPPQSPAPAPAARVVAAASVEPSQPSEAVLGTPIPQSRLALTLAAAGTALFNQGEYGFGGLVEFGPRIRLPFGALSITGRLSVEQHLQPDPAPLLLHISGNVIYVLGRPSWRLAPYVGVAISGLFQRTPLPMSRLGPSAQSTQSGLALGGLVGAELRLWRGGLFTELGYRGAVYSAVSTDVPAWNTAFLLLGYRFHLTER